MQKKLKKKLFATIFATIFSSIAISAHAQSSVTLYGRLDNGVEYMHGVSNAQGQSTSRVRAQSGDWGTAMLGLEGTEDLGGGTRAIFKLESGLNTAVGTAGNPSTGQYFQRYALLGLTNDTYGTFQAGRSLFISNGVWDFDPFVQQAWSSASLVRGRSWFQASNTLNYKTPTIDGFDLAGQYALTNNPNFNQGTASSAPFGRSDGLQLTYTAPNFMARVIYDELRDGQNGKFDDLYNYSREVFVGGRVNLGAFKIQAAYTHMSAPAAVAGAPTQADHEWLGLTYQANPFVAVTVGGFHINANNGAGNATMYEAGGTYALSKRTLLYLTGALVRNSPKGNFSLEATAQNTAGSTNPENPLPGHSQSGLYAGINHAF